MGLPASELINFIEGPKYIYDLLLKSITERDTLPGFHNQYYL